MLSSPVFGTVFGVPVSLALCAVAVLVAILLLVMVVTWVALRRVEQGDLPSALLGLAHIISALCGLLPWGRPTPPPALPQQPTVDTQSATGPTVLLVREGTTDGTMAQRVEP
ncbi:resistance to Congo red protein [Streptomyces sp. NPDC101393]|uniref:resistance to Congo red protein n=1 Tax=Streptomyces sp. NPDC101393 TaxID=3366141 RepID=UPI0037FF835E